MRNNPLKLIHPQGEKATVTITTNEEAKTGTIRVSASIAIWTADSKNISQEALQTAAGEIKASIEQGWKGEYEQNGIKYTVTAEITVQVHSSEDAATDSGAQNVIEMVNGNVSDGVDSEVNPRPLLGGPDTGRWNINSTDTSIPAHEFGHLLGVDNKSGSNLMNGSYYPPPQQATAYDYGWAFGGAINAHRNQSRPIEMKGVLPGNPSGMWGPGQARSGTSVRELRAARRFWR